MMRLTFPDVDVDAAHRWMEVEIESWMDGWKDGWVDG